MFEAMRHDRACGSCGLRERGRGSGLANKWEFGSGVYRDRENKRDKLNSPLVSLSGVNSGSTMAQVQEP